MNGRTRVLVGHLPSLKAAPELGVLVRLHHLLVAIPIGTVSQLVLSSAITVMRRSEPDCPALSDVAGTAHAAWDLGELLGLPPAAEAWVLLKLPHAGTEVRIALGTGACLAVDEIPKHVRLPSHGPTTRAAGIRGGFEPRPSFATKGIAFGLVIEPTALLSRRELELSTALLRKAGAS
jgi:hypothetical protein